VAASGTPIAVQWRNQLPNAYVLRRGDPAAGDVVDTTLHWAFGTTGGSFAADGIPVVTHLHGGHSADEFDGLPEQWFTATGKVGGDYVTNDYVYLNDQEGATLWYHDHALGLTRQNVYAGLAGFYLLRDDNERFLVAGGLIPGDAHEIEMVIQDRMFYPDGRLAYPDASPERADDEAETFPEGQPSHQPEFFGRVILVNGKAWPFLEVEPRQYRFRVLNGSDSRFYDLRLAPSPRLLVIGTDGGLLERPVPVSGLTIGPGERYDVIVDFSAFAGRTILVRNTARSPFPRGDVVDPRLDGLVMQFRVRGASSGPGPVAPVTPATDLRPLGGPIPRLTTTRPVRKLLLFEGTDRFGRLQPLLGTVDPTAPADPATGNPRDGTFLWDDPVTETPGLDTTEIWEIHNATEDAHPIHLHLVQFQILDRQRFSATVVPKQNGDEHTGITFGGALRSVQYRGTAKPPPAQEAGFKDTAIMFPGEVTRVIARFDKPGTWVWHCHILSHEDHEMMRRFSVV
jgi:spore coat protein A